MPAGGHVSIVFRPPFSSCSSLLTIYLTMNTRKAVEKTHMYRKHEKSEYIELKEENDNGATSSNSSKV